MAERYETTSGGATTRRLRTDDGPIVELVVSVSGATIDARLSVYEGNAAQPLADLTGLSLRERLGVVDKVARLITKPIPDPEDLWTLMATQYTKHSARWAKATTAAQSGADAAVASAPGVDRDALVREIRKAAFEQLP